MSTTADVVVIGAGHNGLVAACYLARGGQDVLVVEAADQIGGCTTSGPLIPEAPDHIVNACAADFILLRATNIVRDLRLDQFGYREVSVDPCYAILDSDDASIAFWRDPARTAREIRRYSRRDAAAYLEFTEAARAVLDLLLPLMMTNPVRPSRRALMSALRATRGIRPARKLARLPFMTAREAIEEWFTHPLVRGAFGMFSGLVGPPNAAGSGMNVPSIALLHIVGTGRPVGGTQALPDSLRRCLEFHGGQVRTSAAVDRLLVSGGAIAGVGIGSVEVRAPVVVAACDPRTTLCQLLPPGSLPERLVVRADRIPSRNLGTGHLKVDLALRGQLGLSRHEARRKDDLDLRVPVLLAGTLEEIWDAYEACPTGRLAEPLPITGLVPTAADPTQAPGGQDTLSLWIGWAPLEPKHGWDRARGAAGEAMVRRAAELYDGVDELEIGRLVETPTDIAARTRAPHGNPSHVDASLLRFGPLRPALGLAGYRTPVPGLFISGAGTHPGGSVNGLPGLNAAREVLRHLRSGPPLGRSARGSTEMASVLDPT